MANEPKSFHELAVIALSAEIKPVSLGILLVDTVVKNRKENVEAYKSGRQKDFRNKEEARIFRTVLNAIADKDGIPSIDGVLKDHKERLDKYRDIFYVNFVYDAVKFHYLNTRDMEETAAFVGVRFLNSVGTQQSGIRQSARLKRATYDVKTEEYVRFIASLRSKLQDDFGVVFYK